MNAIAPIDTPRVEVEIEPTNIQEHFADTFKEDFNRSTDIRKKLYLMTPHAQDALFTVLTCHPDNVEDMVKVGKLALEVLRENVVKYPTFSVQQHLESPKRERPKDILVSRDEMVSVVAEALKAEGALEDVKRLAATTADQDAAGVPEVL